MDYRIKRFVKYIEETDNQKIHTLPRLIGETI
jgi:hypothetical protein